MTPSPFEEGVDPATHYRSSGPVRPSESHLASRVPTEFHGCLPVSVHEHAIMGSDLPERAVMAARCGWKSIGLNRKQVWHLGSDRVVELLQDSGLATSTLSWAGGFTGSAGFTYREAIEDGRQAIEDAVRVGAPTLVIAPGSRGGHTFRHAQRVIVDGLRYIAEIASRKQVSLAVLAVPTQRPLARWTCIDTLELAQQILDQVDSRWVGLSLPIERLLQPAVTPQLLASLAPRIRLLTSAPLRAATQLESSPSGLTAAEALPLLQTLRQSGFCGQWELSEIGQGERLNADCQAAEHLQLASRLDLP